MSNVLNVLVITPTVTTWDRLKHILSELPDIQLSRISQPSVRDVVLEKITRPNVDVILAELIGEHYSPDHFRFAIERYYRGAMLIGIAPTPAEAANRQAQEIEIKSYICMNEQDQVIRDKVLWAGHRLPLDLPDSATPALVEPVAPVPDSGLHICLQFHCAYRGEQRIQLSPQEFELLKYLVWNRGRISSSQELLRCLWDCTKVDKTALNQLKKCIYRLRQKIEPDPAHPRFLINSRGHGYYGQDLKFKSE